MDKYEFKVNVEANSYEDACNILRNITEVSSFRFNRLDETDKIRRTIRTLVMEEFAKTESGKMLDSFMKKWFQKNAYTPSQKIERWTDIMHIDNMLAQENITSVKRESPFDDYYTLFYFDPNRNREGTWGLSENGMEAAIKKSKTDY